MKLIRFTVLSACLAGPMTLPLSAQQESEKVDPAAARELIRQWVRTEHLISEEKTAWEVEKKRMQDLLDIYRKELELLNEEIAKAGQSAHLVDEKKQQLQTELSEYQQARQLLNESMARLLPRVLALTERMPAPLLEELSGEIGYLKSDEALGKPRDVLKSMIAVLTVSGRFNRSVTVTEEIRQLDGGGKVSVNVLYLGLSRAFYTVADGNEAGVGFPDPDGKKGWQWQSQPDLADDVRRAIAVYRKDTQPQLIKLPVKVSTPESK